jgi:hypothetical protein
MASLDQGVYQGVVFVPKQQLAEVQAKITEDIRSTWQQEGKKFTEDELTREVTQRVPGVWLTDNGADFDGDYAAFAKAKNYPHLVAEIEQRQQPEYRYSTVHKLAKASFEENSFEAIALKMYDDKSTGIINNILTSIIALESEILVVQSMGDVVEQYELYQATINNLITQDEQNQTLFDSYRDAKADIEQLLHADLQQLKTKIDDFLNQHQDHPENLEVSKINSPEFEQELNRRLNAVRDIYRDLIYVISVENQKAVDMFKLSVRPEVDLIQKLSQSIGVRKVEYFRAKKEDSIYKTHTVDTQGGRSPAELLYERVNSAFQESTLKPTKNEQLKNLIPLPQREDLSQIINQVKANKAEYDHLFNLASELKVRGRTEKGMSMKIRATLEETNNKGSVEFSLCNSLEFAPKLINGKYDPYTPTSIMGKQLDFERNPNSKTKKNYPINVVINQKTVGQIYAPQAKKLGLLNENGYLDADSLPSWKMIVPPIPQQQGEQPSVTYEANITDKQINDLFNQAREVLGQFRENIKPEDLGDYAAVAWHLCTKGDGRNNYVLEGFIEEIVEQLETSDYQDFIVNGVINNDNFQPTLPNETINLKVVNLETVKNNQTVVKKHFVEVDSDGEPLILVREELLLLRLSHPNWEHGKLWSPNLLITHLIQII